MAILKTLAGACLVASALASPTPTEKEAARVEARQGTTGAPITNQNQLDAALRSLSAGATAGAAILTNIVPAPGPSSIPQFAAEIQKVAATNPRDIFQNGAEILLGGLAGPGDFVTIAKAYTIESSTFNINPRPAFPPVYPQNGPNDAPYSLTEAQLRQIIYIPPDFTYGRKPPVLFLPGTGALAGSNFGPNYAKLFRAQNVADPVFVNLPGQNLADIQIAAEYVAYAINYISRISGGRKVNTVSWSAGSLDAQWALKYWPSTRNNVANKISISGDYHGTILAELLCPGFPTPGCTPAVAQQNYNSTFINTLRNNGGDAAYVPTTNIYSIFDEVVQPQQDPNASGALRSGAAQSSNTELQNVCTALLPGGAPNNNHEGVLYNSLAYALAKDAILNNGPGQLSRVNTTLACSQFAAPGLTLADIFATEALIPIAAAAIIAYPEKVATEPPIKAYARKDIPPGF
ncbi:putative alpha/Beta hydrolase [Septoria linicola]|nr:putative alpha/Beta hydrolase [Septoria linicola]